MENIENSSTIDDIKPVNLSFIQDIMTFEWISIETFSTTGNTAKNAF